MDIKKEKIGNKTVYTYMNEEMLSSELKSAEGDRAVISIGGTVRTFSAPCFDEIINDALAKYKVVTLDLRDLSYMASAGLRVLLNMQQKIDEQEQNEVRIRHLSKAVRDVFESTGFINLLDVTD